MSKKKMAEEGILIGNQIDKSNVHNPILKSVVANFDRCLFDALEKSSPTSVHEVGCGEGRITEAIVKNYNIDVLASDFSKILIENNLARGSSVKYIAKSIYDLCEADRRHTIVCCEVLEHLERPVDGVRALARLKAEVYIISVPKEPIWRILNLLRGKYLKDFGNTPGHLNHWSRRTFENLLDEAGFVIDEWLNPFPWLMVRARINKK